MTDPEQQNQENNIANKTGGNTNEPSQEEYYKILKPLRTYERDLAEHVRKTQASKTEVNLKEHERERERAEVRAFNKKESSEPKKSSLEIRKIIIFILIVLITISIGGLIYSLTNFKPSQKISTKVEPEEITTIIKADKEKIIELTESNKESLAHALENTSREEEIGTRQITILYLKDSISGQKPEVTSKKFLERIESHAPPSFLRSLGDKMDFGLFALDKFSSFMVLEIEDFNNAFAGMFQWEKNIGTDLQGWISENGFSEGTFSDFSLKDKDLRVLRDSGGEIVLLYSFLDKKTLLITGKLETFKEILIRL